MSLRLLRGRVMIKPLVERVSKGGIIAPDVALDARTNKNTLGRGIVIMMGPPAFAKDGETECPPDFAVGDTVLFVGQHVSRIIEWEGEKVHMVAQEEVQACCEPTNTAP